MIKQVYSKQQLQWHHPRTVPCKKLIEFHVPIQPLNPSSIVFMFFNVQDMHMHRPCLSVYTNNNVVSYMSLNIGYLI
jgi:hypothetical protein